MQRKQVPVSIFDKERYDGEWPPEEAAAFLAWFKEKVDSVPEEYRSEVKIEIDANSGYEGSCYAQISIYYYRPETDAELEKRSADEQRQKDAQQAKELALLAQLEAKYKRAVGDR